MNEIHKIIPNIWHLHVLRMTVALGGLSNASESLGLTQPAISQALKSLETHFQAPLTVRKGARLELTREGELVLLRSTRALEILIEGIREITDFSAGDAVQLLRAASRRRLEALIAISRHGSFTVAANALHIAAPTLHRAVRDLENAMDVELFESTSYGVKPSRQAERLARSASLAFAELRQAKAEVEAASGRGSGQTVIGTMPLARTYLIPMAVEAFSREHQSHRVTILEGAYDDLLAGLSRGEIDFLVGALRDNLKVKDIVQTNLFSDPLSIVMRANHPAAEKKLTISALRRFSWVAPRIGSPLRQHFENLFGAGPAPANIIECNSLSAARVILMNSNRLMLLSDAQIRYEKKAGMLEARPLPGPPVLRPIGMTTRASWRPTETQSRLVAAIQRLSQSS